MKKFPLRILHDDFRQCIEDKFKIVGFINLFVEDADVDNSKLVSLLSSMKKDKYQNNERIIIQHDDTVFYQDKESVSLLAHNLISVIKNLDIPLYNVIFVTTQKGFQTELVRVCNYLGLNDSVPKVIYTVFFKHYLDPMIVENIDANFSSIVKNYSSLNRVSREHRRMLLSLLSHHNILDKGLVSNNKI